jgi:hypothetical protein
MDLDHSPKCIGENLEPAVQEMSVRKTVGMSRVNYSGMPNSPKKAGKIFLAPENNHWKGKGLWVVLQSVFTPTCLALIPNFSFSFR